LDYDEEEGRSARRPFENTHRTSRRSFAFLRRVLAHLGFCIFNKFFVMGLISGYQWQTTRTLRIFLSHSTSGQVWQTGTDQPTTNVETGEGIPAWSFKVEGRLLEVRRCRLLSLSKLLIKNGLCSLQTNEAATRRHSGSSRRSLNV